MSSKFLNSTKNLFSLEFTVQAFFSLKVLKRLHRLGYILFKTIINQLETKTNPTKANCLKRFLSLRRTSPKMALKTGIKQEITGLEWR